MQPCNEGASDLNVAQLAARVNVHQREVRSLLTFGRFDRHNMLVVLGSNLQLGNRAAALTLRDRAMASQDFTLLDPVYVRFRVRLAQMK